VSFAADARKAKNAELPYLRRLSAFHSCVQRYKPLGFGATLSFVEQLAGQYRSEEAALLRAVKILVESREQWKKEVCEYAKSRAQAKAAGQRKPSPDDPDPSHFPPRWYGAARYAALHALAFRQFRGQLPPKRDSVASEVHTLITQTLTTGGDLAPNERELLSYLTAELSHRCRTSNGAAITQAKSLNQLVQFISTAAN
jgi:hypothetical protein